MRTTWLDTEWWNVYEMVKRILKVNYPLKCQGNMVLRKQFKTLSLFKGFCIIIISISYEALALISSKNGHVWIVVKMKEEKDNDVVLQQFKWVHKKPNSAIFDPNIRQLFSTEFEFLRASQVFLKWRNLIEDSFM